MSEPLKAAPLSAVQKRQAMVVHIVGKVEAVRRYEGKSYTRIVCPAPDLYSKPAIVEVRSSNRIGAKDEEVSLDARLSGYPRKMYSVTDKESGEIVKIIPVEMTLEMIEG